MQGSCLACGRSALELIVSLRPTPPANAVAKSAETARALPRFPLDLLRCADCGHVQLTDEVPRQELFSEYRYATGAAPALVEHNRRLADAVIQRQGLPSGAHVIEVGSNDGTLLRCFRDAGMRVLGIDPAADLVEYACRQGVPSLAAFFGAGVAEEVRQEHGHADIVVANNVLAHVNDVGGVLEGVRTLLKPEGCAVIEAAHVLPMIDDGIFELVYHEHLSYFSLHVMDMLAARHGFVLQDVERIATQGGSLRYWLRRDDAPRAPTASEAVGRLRTVEGAAGIPDGGFLEGFSDRVERVGSRLHDVVGGLTRLGRRISGYGASARAVTMLAQCGLDSEIAWIADDNPRKIGHFTPGSGIPIVKSTHLYEEEVDYCVLFAWNFATDIRTRHSSFGSRGGSFIAPFPELTIT